jgi:hypothetical protein
MSIKTKVLAAAATLTLVGGVGAASGLTAGTASAATPSCGPSCVNIFSKQFGTHAHPNYVIDTLRQGEKVGQPIIQFRTANYDPAEDWTAAYQGTVADFYAAGMVSSALALHYGCIPGTMAGHNFPDCYGQTSTAVNDWAFEIEYAPYGVDSGLCMGLATTAIAGEGVTLQPCGVSSKTVWVVDVLDSIQTTILGGYVPLINGSDTNFSQPFVLTYPATAYPTDMPRAQLYVTNLTGYSNGTRSNPTGVDDNQLFGYDTGVLP